jgi:hypothetical protein
VEVNRQLRRWNWLAGLSEDIVRMFLPALVKNYKPYSTLAEERKYHSWGEEALLEWL